jgi:hypothetical protein
VEEATEDNGESVDKTEPTKKSVPTSTSPRSPVDIKVNTDRKVHGTVTFMDTHGPARHLDHTSEDEATSTSVLPEPSKFAIDSCLHLNSLQGFGQDSSPMFPPAPHIKNSPLLVHDRLSPV